MFTLPPLPPKDYQIKDVRQTQLSAPEHTPFAAPRVTQTTLGKFCSPIEYEEGDKLGDIPVPPVSGKVLDNWADQSRAWWVIKPGKDDYFVHDIFKKYTVQVDPGYDPRYKHKERPFYRSYLYELDCMEDGRLQKLREKTARERRDDEEMWKECLTPKKPPPIKIVPCKLRAPFWWRENPQDFPAEIVKREAKSSEYRDNFNTRWQDEPNLLQLAQSDPCQTRFDMAMVGLPFRNEACAWYYQHYPPPTLSHVHKRFA